jgi:hypothetical protein
MIWGGDDESMAVDNMCLFPSFTLSFTLSFTVHDHVFTSSIFIHPQYLRSPPPPRQLTLPLDLLIFLFFIIQTSVRLSWPKISNGVHKILPYQFCYSASCALAVSSITKTRRAWLVVVLALASWTSCHLPISFAHGDRPIGWPHQELGLWTMIMTPWWGGRLRWSRWDTNLWWFIDAIHATPVCLYI